MCFGRLSYAPGRRARKLNCACNGVLAVLSPESVEPASLAHVSPLLSCEQLTTARANHHRLQIYDQFRGRSPHAAKVRDAKPTLISQRSRDTTSVHTTTSNISHDLPKTSSTPSTTPIHTSLALYHHGCPAHPLALPAIAVGASRGAKQDLRDP